MSTIARIEIKPEDVQKYRGALRLWDLIVTHELQIYVSPRGYKMHKFVPKEQA